METQLSKTYSETEDYLFRIEYVEDSILLHCEVYNWKPSVLRRGYSVIASLMNEKGKEGYVRLFTVTPNPKFAKLFGGMCINKFYHEGIHYEVVVWDLNLQ